jgi:hypothetical protein
MNRPPIRWYLRRNVWGDRSVASPEAVIAGLTKSPRLHHRHAVACAGRLPARRPNAAGRPRWTLARTRRHYKIQSVQVPVRHDGFPHRTLTASTCNAPDSETSSQVSSYAARHNAFHGVVIADA